MPNRFFFNPFSTPILSQVIASCPELAIAGCHPRPDGVAIACCQERTSYCTIDLMHPIAQPDRTHLPLITDY